MRIPEKYRDRYDRLALSHPWMREMRDEQPCTFEGEKVQGSDEPPGGDAVNLLRTYAASEQSHDDPEFVMLGKNVLAHVADMVERGYVRREEYDEAIEMRDSACGDAAMFKAERDELKSRHCPHYHADKHYCDVYETRIKTLIADRDELLRKTQRLEAERDELKAELESEFTMCMECSENACAEYGQLKSERDEWKARAEGSSSAKRAAAVERLREMNAAVGLKHVDVINALVPGIPRTSQDIHAALIDLLTDDGGRGMTNLEWLYEHEPDTLRDALRCIGGGIACDKCAVYWYNYKRGCDCEGSSVEWLLSPHSDPYSDPESYQREPENAMDANDSEVIRIGEKDNLAPESEAASHTDGGKVEADTREKLEADVRDLIERNFPWHGICNSLFGDVCNWLDRQAAITRAECERICDTCEWPDLAKQPDREAYDRIAELQAERDKFSELSTARGRTIETLEHMLAERKGKYRETLEQKLKHQRNITAERDQYRELYEAAMSTDYAAAARERDKMHDQIKQIRSIITNEKPDDRLVHD